MFGNGALGFLDDQMDFNVRVNARGLPGVLLFPVSKLFEYVADDKLSKPHWRPKALPKLQGGGPSDYKPAGLLGEMNTPAPANEL